MLKKIVILLITFLLAFSMVACGEIGGTDIKTVFSAEFREFENQTVTILKNAGVELNKLEEPEKKADVKFNADNIALLKSGFFEDSKQEIIDLVLNDERAVEIKDNYVVLDSIEQTTSVSLISGYCLSHFYGEENLYNIVMHSPSDQYIKNVKEGTKIYSYVYTPERKYEQNGFDLEESCCVFVMDYKNEKDYKYNAVSFNPSGTMFVYFSGDSNLENFQVQSFTYRKEDIFKTINYNTANYEKSYLTGNHETVDEVLSKLSGEFEKYNFDEIRKLRDHVDYEISEEHFRAASDYYFPVPDNQVEMPRVEYFYSDEEKTILEEIIYNYPDQIDEVVKIPENVKGLAADFRVRICGEGIKEFYIPKSVEKIWGYNYDYEKPDNPEKPEKPDNPEKPDKPDNQERLVEVSPDKFRIIVEYSGNMDKDPNKKGDDGKEDYLKHFRFFSKFTVEEGSKIFESSENGHLKTKSGQYVAYVNAPIESGKITYIFDGKYESENPLEFVPVAYFDKLYGSIEEIDYIIKDTRYAPNIDITKNFVMPNFKTANVKVECKSESDVSVDTFIDYKFNLNLYGNAIFRVTQQKTDVMSTLTVNLKDDGYLSLYTFDGKIIVNAPFGEEKNILPHDLGNYNERKRIEFNKDQDITVNYAKSDKKFYTDVIEYGYSGGKVIIDGKEVTPLVAVIYDNNYETIEIPAFVEEYPITEVVFSGKMDKLTKLNLPEYVSKIRSEKEMVKDDLTVSIKNPKFELSEIFSNSYRYRFNVEIAGKKQMVSNFVKVTVKCEGKEYNIFTDTNFGHERIYLNNNNISELKLTPNQRYLVTVEGSDFQTSFTPYGDSWDFSVQNEENKNEITVIIKKFVKNVNLFINGTKVLTAQAKPGDFVIFGAENSTVLKVTVGVEKGENVKEYTIDLTKYGITSNIWVKESIPILAENTDDMDVYFEVFKGQLKKVQKLDVSINNVFYKTLFVDGDVFLQINNSTVLKIDYFHDTNAPCEEIDLTKYGIKVPLNYACSIYLDSLVSANKMNITINAEEQTVNVYKKTPISVDGVKLGIFEIPVGYNVDFVAENGTTLYIKYMDKVLATYDLKKSGVTVPVRFSNSMNVGHELKSYNLDYNVEITNPIETKLIINGKEIKLNAFEYRDVRIFADNSTKITVDCVYNRYEIDLTKYDITKPVSVDIYMDYSRLESGITLNFDKDTGKLMVNAKVFCRVNKGELKLIKTFDVVFDEIVEVNANDSSIVNIKILDSEYNEKSSFDIDMTTFGITKKFNEQGKYQQHNLEINIYLY